MIGVDRASHGLPTDGVCGTIRIEFLLVVIISIKSKFIFSFYFSFLFSFNVVALTSSRLASLSPYRCTSIRQSIATADHSSHLVIISSPLHFFLHCFSIGIHISLLIKKGNLKTITHIHLYMPHLRLHFFPSSHFFHALSPFI